MAEIRFSPDAVTDLRDIETYISDELGNKHASKEIVQKILKQIRLLSEFPNLGAPLSSVVDLDTNYRFLVSGSYLTFYRTEGNEVYIVRILYGRRNYLQVLFGVSSDEDEMA